MDSSDYPLAVQQIPRIGNIQSLNLEAIIARKPDLILAWQGGQSAQKIAALRRLNYPIYFSDPSTFTRITTTLHALGILLNRTSTADKLSQQFLQRLHQIKKHHSHPVRIFYQVYANPLITVNRNDISDAIFQFCGGQNIFAQAKQTAPLLSIEAVLAHNPDVIIATATHPRTAALQQLRHQWQPWQTIKAVRHDQLYIINSDIIQRPTLRVLNGIQRVCQILDQVRQTTMTQTPKSN